jgi:prepilin-type N-terminal cleavage/methylation domain-containing protein
MFNKIFYFIKKSSSRRKCTLKQEKGFSLVEVIVAIVIISIITVVLVRGTITAVTVSKMNRAKTLSSAVASEKLELIKCMDYEKIEIKAESLDWEGWKSDHPELFEVGYDIDYEITWVDGVKDSYKQVEISVYKENMNMKSVSVITYIYPLKGPEEEIEHPAPLNLNIKDDSGSGWLRSIVLEWEAPELDPDSGLVISKYNIYRDNAAYPIASKTTTSYTDSLVGDNEVHSYYVTAVYNDGVVSGKSNKVTTEYLRITGYSGAGPNRTVYLAWGKAPDIGVKFIKFVVYKDGGKYTELTDQWYSDKIGKNNYTYYVTAIYEGGIESDPSNEVTTK